VDLPFVVRRTLKRFEPKQIVLIESEVWPNLLVLAKKSGTKITVANARLSARSEKRYHKVKGIIAPLFSLFDRVGVPDERDVKRWADLGVRKEALVVTGSVKFDQQGAAAPEKKAEFQTMLDTFGAGRNVVMVLSSHIGEEKWIAKALLGVNALIVVVPRHAERRAEVKSDLESLGIEVVLRSEFRPVNDPMNACLVVDSTGELKNWTAHADVAVVGKSFLGKGGQNPTEAIAAGVPVVTGPNMQNFEPLMSMLESVEGVKKVGSGVKLRSTVEAILEGDCSEEVSAAKGVLLAHQGATRRTVLELRV
jgi:3-deoxy-D-manno-octulosonic-acid transferase